MPSLVGRGCASCQEDPEQHFGEQGAVQLGLALFGHHVIGSAHEAEQQPHDQQVRVNHAGDVEGDRREQEVTDDVLQAQRQTEDDLAGEQAQCGNEVELGYRLRLVFDGCGLHRMILKGWI